MSNTEQDPRPGETGRQAEGLERDNVAAPEKKHAPKLLKAAFLSVAGLLFLVFLFLFSSGYSYLSYFPESRIVSLHWDKAYRQPAGQRAEQQSGLKKQLAELRNKNKKMRKTVDAFMPKSEYIVIDSAYNRLYMRKGEKTLLDAACSAGSGAVLADTPSGRKWVFDTPRGAFQVLSRQENPVWKKPDWAFIEEGQPIPKDPSERYEYGMLGEYALYFSKDGYLIHGTLYERLLGRSITHGCIRLGRDDLRVLYHSTKIGTKVYAY